MANLAVTQAAVFYVFRCLLDEDCPPPLDSCSPSDRRAEGQSERLPPAAMAAGQCRDVAAHHGCPPRRRSQRPRRTVSRRHQRNDEQCHIRRLGPGEEPPVCLVRDDRRRHGASSTHDGMSAVHTHMTNSWNTPVEASSTKMLSASVNTRSAAVPADKECTAAVTASSANSNSCPAEATILADRRISRPYGLACGEPGSAGITTHIRAISGEERQLSGKVRLTLCQGDRLRIETPGGGGFGSAG